MPTPPARDVVAGTVSASTGASSFRVPIEAPPGPGGLAPELSLRYSSRAGDGPLGVGWFIQPMGEIRCSARFGVPDYASCLRYELDGELLSEDPANPGRFHTFVESFKRITRHTSGVYAGSWEVVLPTGTILRYGLDAGSRLLADASGAVASWQLSEMQSPFGPRIVFHYTDDPDGLAQNGSDAGVLYPARVSWAEGARSIDFHYEPRPDPIRDFRGGLERHIAWRLREVEVRSNGNLYQRRVVGYAAPGAYTTGRSRIAWVQVFGTDCSAPDPLSACQGLPRQEFDYTDVPGGGGPGVQWVEMPSYQVPLGGNVHVGEPPEHMADIDGDGLVDRLVAGIDLQRTETVEVLLNTGAGFARDDGWTAAFQGLTSWFARVDVRQIEDADPADFWGEFGGVEAGICEFVSVVSNAEPIGEEFSTRARPHVRFSSNWIGDPLFDSHLEARGRWLLTDLDADGRADLVMSMRLSGVHATLDCADGSPRAPVYHPGISLARVYRNTGAGWELDPDLASGLPPFEEVSVEGAHYIERHAGTPYTYEEVEYLPGEPTNACWARGLAGLWKDLSFFARSDLCYNQINLDPRFVDFNADGVVDLMVLERDDPRNPWAGYGDSPKMAANPARSRAWLQRPGEIPRWVRAPEFDLPLEAPAGLPLPMDFAHSWSDHSQHPEVLGCSSSGEIVCVPTSYNRSTGMQLVDLNRDGLVDVVWSLYAVTIPPTVESQGVLLNMGRGSGGSATGSAWCASDPAIGAFVGQTCSFAARYLPPAVGDGFAWSFDPYHSAVAGFMGDLNGDGLIDYLNHSARWAGRTRSWLHDPAAAGTWVADERYDLPMTQQDWFDANAIWNCCMNSGFAVVDVNGDGVVDVLGDTKAFVSRHAHADLVSETRNGQGAVLKLRYASAAGQRDSLLETAASDHASEPGIDEALSDGEADVLRWSSLAVVASLTQAGPSIQPEPGISGVTTHFRYAHPRFCRESRSDLGFRVFERSDPDGASQRSLFFQRHGRVGRTSRRLHYDALGSLMRRHEEDWELPDTLVPGSILHPDVHVGRLLETRTSNQYPSGAGSLPGAERVRTLAYDAGGVRGVGVEHGYNFVLEIREQRPSGELFVRRMPALDLASHLVWRVGEERVEDAYGRLLAHTRLSYFDEALQSTFGEVALREVWDATRYVAGGEWRATRFRHDAYGNLVERESPGPGGARRTRFCYDGDAGCSVGHDSHSLLVGVQEPSLDGGSTPGAWRRFEPHATLARSVRVTSDYRDQPTLERVYDPFGRLVEESLIPEGGDSTDAVLLRVNEWRDLEPPQLHSLVYADESGSLATTVETIQLSDGFGGSWKQVWATPTGYAARLRWQDPAARRVRESLPVDCGGDASCASHDGSAAPAEREVALDALGRPLSVATPSGVSSFHYRSELRSYPAGAGARFDATLAKNGKGDLRLRLEDGERLVWLDECHAVMAPSAVLDASDGCGPADSLLYTYEPSGEIFTVYDATAQYWDPNHYLRYHYDTQARVIRIDDPDLTGSGASERAYDAAGNLAVATNARGETRSFFYDAADRLILVDPSPEDETSVFVVYRPGEWKRGHEFGSEYARSHSYDGFGRMARESLQVPGYLGGFESWWTLVTDYDRDLLGRIRGLTHPDSTRLRYEYAGAYLDRVCELRAAALRCGDSDAVAYLDAAGYDDLGRVELLETPAGDRSFGYDVGHRLASDDFVAAGSSYVYSRRYDAYDGLGNLLGTSGFTTPGDVAMDQAFGYDNRNRLASWSGSMLPAPALYAYDVLGNLTLHAGRSQRYDDPGRPHAITRREDDGADYGYDADGNVVSILGSGRPRHFGFDSANRLVCAGSSAGSCDGRIVYDLAGQRVLDVEGTTRKVFVGGGFEYSRNLAALGWTSSRVEIAGPGGPLAFKLSQGPVLRTASGEAPAAGADAPLRRFELADPLGSGLVILDETGARVRHLRFEPFGRVHQVAGVRAYRRHFAGQLFDASKGLYDMKARWYDPDAGRFVSMDPLVANPADSQSYNAYAYARNNPVSFLDPTGRSAEPVEGATDLADEPAEVASYASGNITFTVSTTSSAAAGAEWRRDSESGPGGAALPRPGVGIGSSVSPGIEGAANAPGAALEGATDSRGASQGGVGLPTVAQLVGAEGAAQIETLTTRDDTGSGWLLVCTDYGCFSSHSDPDIARALAEQGTTAAVISVAILGSATPSGGMNVARGVGGQALSGAAQGFMQGQAFGNGAANSLPRTPPGVAASVGYWVGFAGGVATSKILVPLGK